MSKKNKPPTINGNNSKEHNNNDLHISNVKVSIVIPCYNVEKYLAQCLNSVVNQTLKEIEIICVNDGSTDQTLNIIKKFAAKDLRISIINKKNSGYGDSMNQGFSHARGQYVGLVESDDFVEPTMFETLYRTAIKYDADVVKSNFWFYWSNPEKNELYEYFKEEECGHVIIPSEYDRGSLYSRKPSIWSAIYKQSFLKNNNIAFLPTPGASYQDTSFTFKVYSASQRMVCIHDAFLHYRQDNENSSINNADKKMNCVLDEYEEIKRYINNFSDVKLRNHLYPIYGAAFYDTCIWMYERLTPKSRWIFLNKISPILKQIVEDVGVENINFGDAWWKRRDIVRISNDPYEYHMWRNDERYDQEVANISYPEAVTPINNVALNKLRLNNEKAPFFSIIIPVYNVEKYLPSALDSLLFQTYNNIEIICINDGSTDHSLSVIEGYAKNDDRIIIINQENSGPSAARNNGLTFARGKYICFLDADDYLSVDTFETLKIIIENKKEPDAVEFGAEPFPASPKASDWVYHTLSTPDAFYSKVDQKTFLTTMYLRIYCWRYCFKRDFIKKIKVSFDTDFKYGEDAIFLMNALSKISSLYVISDILYHYRHYRTDSLMNQLQTKNIEFADCQLSILGKMLLEAFSHLEYKPSPEFFEYCCDFVYGSIDNCPPKEKRYYIVRFLSLMEKYNLLEYVDECSENCRGFLNYCLNERKIYNNERSIPKQLKYIIIKLISKLRHFIARIVPPSRKVFYEHSSRLIDQIKVQQNSLNALQSQINNLQSKIDRINNKNSD